MTPRGMVIVGAGECGARAAFAVREAGYGNSAARDTRLAEVLIGRRAAPPGEGLAAPDTKLRSLSAA